MSGTQDEQAIALLWVVAVLFFSKDLHEAIQQIQAGAIKLNGEIVFEALNPVRVGDTLAHRNDHRSFGLHGFRKTQALCREKETFFGGREAMFRRLGVGTPPVPEQN
jgi:hypothetical protein